MGDTLTVLTTAGPRLTKVWDSSTGKPKGYENALQVSVQERVVTDIYSLTNLLNELDTETNSCIIRGKFIGHAKAREKYPELIEADAKRGKVTPTPKEGFTLRRKALFDDRPLHYFMIDIDHFKPASVDPVTDPEDAINQYIENHLPTCFHGITYRWQLSSGAGHPDNAGVLKAHVWFWLTTPYVGDDLELWAENAALGLDPSVFRTVQPNYTAAPVFRNGVLDPVPVRSGLWQGWMDDAVDLVVDDALLVRARKERKGRQEMVDPSEKPGDIGAFCRTFEIEEVVARWLPHVFEFVTDTRLNFLLSNSGAAEGVGVCDNRQGLFNTHASDPFKGRAANKWDLVRHYVFGHLDADLDQDDKVLLGPGGWPSQIAMVEMVRGLPEIKALKASVVDQWLDQIDAAEDEVDLQQLLEDKLAFDKSLTVIDLAKIENAVKKRFSDLGLKLPVATIRKMLKKKGVRPLPDINAEGRPQETEANLQTICDNNGLVIRYNVIKKDCEILIPGAAWSIDNRANAAFTTVRSICHKEEVPTKYLKEFVTLLADKNLYNPVAEWITSKPWDGVSRIQSLFDTVVENEEECSKKIKEMLMLRWLMSAVAAAMSPNGVMARGVLVFQGLQYAGKTRWIESLAPKSLEFVKTGKALNVHDKDSVKQILSAWISELGELDATFKKSDIAALKAFLTLDTDEMRRPYAPSESTYARRTVFAASVNEKQFLQDPTGNTRFWVIPIKAIKHDHTLDMQQIWAELYEIWKSGEQHYLKPEEMALLNHHNSEFETPNPIAELVTNGLNWDQFSPENCKWMTASDVLRWLDVKNPSKWDSTEAGRVIGGLNGGLRKRIHGVRYIAVAPTRKMHISEFGNTDDTDSAGEF